MSWSFPPVLLMHARYDELVAAIAGFKATGVPLVGLVHGQLYAAGFGDNLGMYFFASLIARTTGLSAEGAATVLFCTVLAGALAIGGWGWWHYARRASVRVLGIAAMLFLATLAYILGDDYIVLASMPLACTPPLLLLWRRGGTAAAWTRALLLTGLAAGTAALVRGESGLSVCVFAGALVWGRERETRGRRALQLLVLLAGVAMPVLGFRAVTHQRDAYLTRAVPGYEPPPAAHVIWHSMYIGFGFLTNDRGLEYKDEVAGRVAARLAPGAPAYSRRYNEAIRGEVVKLLVGSPAFAARTVFAKIGILLMYLVVFGNVGLIAALRARKPAPLELAFAAALAAAALPGLLIFPVLRYMEGFTSLVVVYALTSIEWALPARRRPA